jgi:AcrR family transcriptional regulator
MANGLIEEVIMQNARPETGWRGSREVWLEAAHELLVQSGIESVTIQSLSKRLKIARTSFYWHFEDRQALVTALADRWASRTSDGMIAACTAFAETEAEAMLNVIGCFLGDKAFDSALEFAIRSWAQSDPQIMERVHREDLLRLEALVAMFNRWGHFDVDAETRARTVYLTQIGYISMRINEPIALRMRRVPSYVQIYTGIAPAPREIARFHAQHNFVPEAEDAI